MERHRPAPRGRGKNPCCLHPLPSGRVGASHSFPEGLPRASPSPSLGLLSLYSLHFTPSSSFRTPKPLPIPPEKNFQGKGKRENTVYLGEMSIKRWLDRSEPASSRPQPALQHCWPKASVTSPVKRGLEQRGSWGLKYWFSADRRLCWIRTVHAPHGNLCLSLSCVQEFVFPSRRLPPTSPGISSPLSPASFHPALVCA